ncbi:MAG: hypothetical protein WBY94_27460, partial [Polyangiaceae bacterium]
MNSPRSAPGGLEAAGDLVFGLTPGLPGAAAFRVPTTVEDASAVGTGPASGFSDAAAAGCSGAAADGASVVIGGADATGCAGAGPAATSTTCAGEVRLRATKIRSTTPSAASMATMIRGPRGRELGPVDTFQTFGSTLGLDLTAGPRRIGSP